MRPRPVSRQQDPWKVGWEGGGPGGVVWWKRREGVASQVKLPLPWVLHMVVEQ